MSQKALAIIVMVGGTVLVGWGFSESCSTEITSKLAQYIPLVGGGIWAWFNNVKTGSMTLGGLKK